MDQESLLLEALQPPISRGIWDNVIKCNDIQLLLSTLAERLESRKTGKDWIPHPAEINGPIKTVTNINIFMFVCSNLVFKISSCVVSDRRDWIPSPRNSSCEWKKSCWSYSDTNQSWIKASRRGPNKELFTSGLSKAVRLICTALKCWWRPWFTTLNSSANRHRRLITKPVTIHPLHLFKWIQ